MNKGTNKKGTQWMYLVNIFCSFSTPNWSFIFMFVEGVMEFFFSAVILFSVVYLHVSFVSDLFIVFIYFTAISVSVSGIFPVLSCTL